MARLIDADALLENVENLKTNLYGWHDYNTGVEGAVYKIESAPTVDAVEVVRCGECWAYNQPDCPMSGSPGRVSVSDFCSYGERRTDD